MNLAQQAIHLSNFEQSQTWEARCNRLRAMVIRAKEDGDQELLATLKAQWQALRAEVE